MRRPSLRSQLNQIRLWLRQGRTDAWIAHKLDVSREQLEKFKREHIEEQPTPPEAAPALAAEPAATATREPREAPPEAEEVRPQRDRFAGIAPGADEERFEAPEDLDAEPAEEPEQEPDSLEDLEAAGPPAPEGTGEEGPPRRRRRRRGGRRRRGRAPEYEATLDRGEEGYELRLDPAVADNPVYAEHWAGQRSVKVSIAAETITIRRVGDDAEEEREE
jgi:hypothetical protein